MSVTRIDRRQFVAGLLAACPEARVVTGLGSPSYDVFAAGDSPNHFYLWGAMGGCTALALGLALARPELSIIAITGDGEQLMGIGSLATAAAQRPSNLTVVVLDNGHFGETGMQASHTSLGTDLVAVARGCGIGRVMAIDSLAAIGELAAVVGRRDGFTFAQVFVASDDLPRALPPRDGAFLKNRFMQGMGLAPL